MRHQQQLCFTDELISPPYEVIIVVMWYGQVTRLYETSNSSYWMRSRPYEIAAMCWHDDVIKWKHFPRYWPFVRGIHRSPVNSPHKGQWHGAWMFSLICVGINGWVNNREAGDLRHYRAHYDVSVMRTMLLSHTDDLVTPPYETNVMLSHMDDC